MRASACYAHKERMKRDEKNRQEETTVVGEPEW